MIKKRQVVLIVLTLTLSSLALPVIGLPYDSIDVLASSLLQYGREPTATPTAISTILDVDDQDASSGMVIVERVQVGIRSWILIHNQSENQPGDIIGSAIVPYGETLDVVIPIDLNEATPVLYASLHADWGAAEVYDPNLDVQTTDFIPFNVILAEPTEEEVVAPTPTERAVQATEAPPPTATPAPVEAEEPDELPNLLLLLLALCVVGLFAGGVSGVVIFLLMRSRTGDSEPLGVVVRRFFGQDSDAEDPSE